jgi:hypothetical protein
MSDEHDDLYGNLHDDFSDDLPADHDSDEEIEAYCMTCKQKTTIEHPEPIWTRRGAPGTRGVCPVCGTMVFRMGSTPAHQALRRPEPLKVLDTPRSTSKNQRKPASAVTYLNYSVSDAEFAEILAEDLNRIGIQTWMASSEVDDVNWATGVHPALVECKNMIIVLSPLAIKATNVQEALKFFVGRRKPIVVAELHPTDLPDDLRRKPRFDFSGDDYKQKFRELVQALNG